MKCLATVYEHIDLVDIGTIIVDIIVVGAMIGCMLMRKYGIYKHSPHIPQQRFFSLWKYTKAQKMEQTECALKKMDKESKRHTSERVSRNISLCKECALNRNMLTNICLFEKFKIDSNKQEFPFPRGVFSNFK